MTDLSGASRCDMLWQGSRELICPVRFGIRINNVRSFTSSASLLSEVWIKTVGLSICTLIN